MAADGQGVAVLIVEDEPAIAGNLYDFLEACGYACDYAATLAEAGRRCREEKYAVLLVDRNLPDGDGIDLIRRLRAAGDVTPALLLTARDDLEDKLDGFAAGADDYLVKPFALREVAARLLVLQRRALAQRPERLVRGGFQLDPATRAARFGERELQLSPKAWRLLAALLACPGEVCRRRELEIAVWGEAQPSSDNLRSVLLGLRKALAPLPGVHVENVHGLGYRLVLD
jgi:DNA-binding response OmpR family regulator